MAGTVLEHVQTAAVAVDDDGCIGVYNPAAARVLDVPAVDVSGRRVDEITGPPALAALAGVLREARRSGAGAARRQVVVPIGGAQRTLGYSVSILGVGGSAAVFFADLTDALAEERRIAEAQRFAEVGRIAGAMTHELRLPLATVELYANLMRKRFADDDAALEQLDVIKGQTRQCLDRLREITHSMNPDAALAHGTVLTPLEPLMRDVVEHMRRRYVGAEVSLDCGAADLRVALRENDVRSVIGNLIDNALEVTGGIGPVDVSLRAQDGRAVIDVADGGPGLPSADVFAAFFSTKASGTGLGLWLVCRLVESAGGSIAAADRPGGGALFTVTLPLPRRESLRGARVLLVEDDMPLRTAEAEALASCGVQVTAVGAGSQVPAEEAIWGCAVLEYRLPDDTGVKIAQRLPEGLPVLLVSGDPLAGGVLAEIRDRRAWYLPKPYEVGTLLDLVSLLVGVQ